MRRVHVIVHGDVHGVGFRAATRAAARAAGVNGWVRNRTDGTVEGELEGRSADVDAVIAWLADGPPGAHVARVSTTEIAPAGTASFEVRPSG